MTHPARRPRTVNLATLTQSATTNVTHYVCCHTNRSLCGFDIDPDAIGDCTVECRVCNDLVDLTHCPHDGKKCP